MSKRGYNTQEIAALVVVIGIGVAVMVYVLSHCNFSSEITIPSFDLVLSTAFLCGLAVIMYGSFLSFIVIIVSEIFKKTGKAHTDLLFSDILDFSRFPIIVALISAGIVFVLISLGIIESANPFFD